MGARMKSRTTVLRLCLTVAVVAMVGACATTKPEVPTGPVQPSKAQNVTFESEPDAKLGTVVRRIGESTNGGIVLMQGLEWYNVGSVAFRNEPLQAVAQKLAKTFEGSSQAAAGYHFIYPAGYDMLAGVSFEGLVTPEMAARDVSIAFGAGTQLYSVLAVLGRSLGVTLVADNAIAESQCGELALPELPLPTVLEAVLKSARIPNEAFEVLAGPNFAMIRGRGVPLREPVLLNEAVLSETQRQFLDQNVSIELPYPQTEQDAIEVFPGASPLMDVLPSLTHQLGIRVTAERALADLPVNPTVLNDVSRQTAMELLIRQWLVPQYGFTLEADRVVIRQLPTDE